MIESFNGSHPVVLENFWYPRDFSVLSGNLKRGNIRCWGHLSLGVLAMSGDQITVHLSNWVT